MRLLDTKFFEVREFQTNIPPYAILSHTWGEDEVSFQDIQNLGLARCKKGWPKVQNACEYARNYKFDWIWIDTCCIDKSSSAELSEALNSMYQYYRDGRVCIAYLSDVLAERNVKDIAELKKSRWFTRGWTLQELIAPRYVTFLDQDWKMIGTRFTLREVISEVTSIPIEVFELGWLDGYSIAQKMSWAASRETTRPEDMAYCLLGLFGVNMPPIYGEGGAKAFMRLQQEIIKYSDDRSIFAWVASQDYHRDRGLFASSPSEFASSGEVGMSISDDLGDKSSFSFGNNGLHIHLPLHYLPNMMEENIFFASLHCRDTNGFIGIYLQRKGHHYIRWCPHFALPHIDESSGDLQDVVVKESIMHFQRIENDNHNTLFEFRLDSQIALIDEIVDNNFNPLSIQSRSFSLRRYSPRTFRLRTKKGKRFGVTLWTFPNGIIPAVKVQLAIDHRSIGYDSDFLLQDSHLLPIEYGEVLLSCSVLGTGDSSNRRIVEINYIPASSAQFMLYHQINGFQSLLRISHLKTLNFLVEAVSDSDDFDSVPSVFPSNLVWRQDDRKAYVSFSKNGEQCDMHCVFTYVWEDWWSKKFIFITLGLRTKSEHHTPWIDVFVSSDEIPTSDVWNSYLLSGSRNECKQNSMATASLNRDMSLIVTAEKKTSLEPGLTHVIIETKRL